MISCCLICNLQPFALQSAHCVSLVTNLPGKSSINQSKSCSTATNTPSTTYFQDNIFASDLSIENILRFTDRAYANVHTDLSDSDFASDFDVGSMGMYSNIIVIGHFIGIGIGQCECTVNYIKGQIFFPLDNQRFQKLTYSEINRD